MGWSLRLPKIEEEIIVETSLMRRTAARTLAVHRGGGLVVWHGRQRLGKTISGKWLSRQINGLYSPENPDSFHVVHYQALGVQTASVKSGIRSLYEATIARLDESTFRQLPGEQLAQQLVYGLRRKAIQMVLIDEAGTLSLDAIRGMVTVRDVAENERWTLTLVFIGMDDLPAKMTHLPQVEGRIHEWCYFEPYTLDEVWKLLSEFHPFFAGLDARQTAHRELVEFLYEQYGGVPGLLAPFVRKLAQRIDEGEEPDMLLFRGVHLATARDMNRALKDSRGRYRGELPESTPDAKQKKPSEKAKKPKPPAPSPQKAAVAAHLAEDGGEAA